MIGKPTTETSTRAASWHSPLSVPVFRRMWVGQFATNVGMMIQSVAAAWVMTTLTPSPQWIASVQAAVNAPVMIWAIVAGVLADMYDRRLVMLGAQTMLLLAAAALSICSLLGLVGPWLLLLLTFLIGSASAVRGPAWNASVVEQVGPDVVAQAVSFNAIAFNTARCIGPAIGGLIVASSGANTAFAVNAALAIAMIYAILAWRRPWQQKTEELARELVAEAARYVREDRMFRALLVRLFCFGFTGSVLWSLMPLLAQTQFPGRADIFGFMLTIFGLGSVLGSFAVPISRKAPIVRVAIGTTALFNLSSILVPLCSQLWQTLLLLFVAGLAWVTTLALFNISVQLSVSPKIMGRAFALYQMMIFGSMAIGAMAWGVVTEEFGLVTAFACASILGLFSLLLARQPGNKA